MVAKRLSFLLAFSTGDLICLCYCWKQDSLRKACPSFRGLASHPSDPKLPREKRSVTAEEPPAPSEPSHGMFQPSTRQTDSGAISALKRENCAMLGETPNETPDFGPERSRCSCRFRSSCYAHKFTKILFLFHFRFQGNPIVVLFANRSKSSLISVYTITHDQEKKTLDTNESDATVID